MARKKRKTSFEALLLLLLTAILITLIALLLNQIGYLTELKLPDLPILEHLGISVDKADDQQPSAYTEGEVKVCFIDVGQGDSTLIVAPEATVLIDGGTPANGSVVYSLLKEQGIKRLDYVINTHPHSDHVGGLAQVVKSLGKGNVKQVLITEYPDELEPNIQSWPDFLKRAELCGAQISAVQLDEV